MDNRTSPDTGIPRRVRMTRSTAWRGGSPGAVIVDRTTKWGNPFKAGESYRVDWHGDPIAPPAGGIPIPTSRSDVVNTLVPPNLWKVLDAEHAARLFDSWARLPGRAWPLDELAGRDLACWCPLWDETMACPECGGPDGRLGGCPVCEGTGHARHPCHGDVLLILANPGTTFPWKRQAAKSRKPGWVLLLPDGEPSGQFASLWDMAADLDMDEREAERLGQAEGWTPASVAGWIAETMGLEAGQVRIERAAPAPAAAGTRP